MSIWVVLQLFIDVVLIGLVGCLVYLAAKQRERRADEAVTPMDKKEIDTLVETIYHLLKELEQWSESYIDEVLRRRDEIKGLIDELERKDEQLRGICEKAKGLIKEVPVREEGRAETKPLPRRYEEVLKLAEEGLDAGAIGSRIKMPVEQIRMILGLKRRSERTE